MLQRIRFPRTAFAALSLLALFGCGGDDQDDETTTSSEAHPLTIAPALRIGANIHHGAGSSAGNQQLADVMRARRLTTARMDLTFDDDFPAFRDQVQRLRAGGTEVETALFPSYQWDARCALDRGAVEADAYKQTRRMVDAVKDLVHDFELMNEVTLRSELQAEIPTNSNASAAAYASHQCYMEKAAVLRGMFRAIRDARTESGLPLRVIVGTVGRDWGYLDFVRQQGIDFDVVGYHDYPLLEYAPLDADPWFGNGGPLGQLARFDRPVHFNEFHCGEIYGAGYENRAGQPQTEKCLRSIAKHMLEIVNQKVARVESVHFYELLDEAGKGGPEGRFGLMYSLGAPKVHLSLAAAFSGGALTTAEQNDVVGRGLLDAAKIASFRDAGATAPSKGIDLVVSSVGRTTTAVAVGDAVRFTATIRNAGDVATPEGTILGVAFSVDGKVVAWSDTEKRSLGPGQSVTVVANFGPQASATWTPRAAGTFVIGAHVDDVNRLREANEANNTASASLVVGMASPPPVTFEAITNRDYVAYLYRFLLGREPDASGLDAYASALDRGTPKVQVESNIFGSTEARSRASRNEWSPAPSTNALSDVQFLSAAFVALLRRDISASELASYVSRLGSGTSRTAILREVTSSPEFGAAVRR